MLASGTGTGSSSRDTRPKGTRLTLTPEQLREARRQLKLTQLEAGQALGVTDRTIRSWESDGGMPPDALDRLFDYHAAREQDVPTPEARIGIQSR